MDTSKPKKVLSTHPKKKIFLDDKIEELNKNHNEEPFIKVSIIKMKLQQAIQELTYKSIKPNNTCSDMNNLINNQIDRSTNKFENIPHQPNIKTPTNNKIVNFEEKIKENLDLEDKIHLRNKTNMYNSTKQYQILNTRNLRTSSERSCNKILNEKHKPYSTQSFKSEKIKKIINIDSKLLNDINNLDKFKLKTDDNNNISGFSQKEEECIKRLQSRILTKGDELILNSTRKQTNFFQKEITKKPIFSGKFYYNNRSNC